MLNSYQEILQLPSPTKEENKILIAKAISGGSKEKWELVTRNIKLIYSIAQRYYAKLGEGEEEIVSDGIIGLYKAVCRLRPCVSEQFITYGGAYIQNEIARGIQRKKSYFNAATEYTIWIPVSINKLVPFDFSLAPIEEIIPDIGVVTAREACEITDMTEFSKKLVKSICCSEEIKLSKKQRNALTVFMAQGGNVRATAKELGVTRQDVDVVIKRIIPKIQLYLFKKFGSELEDIFGIKGKKLHFKLYNNEGKRSSKISINFRHSTKEAMKKYRDEQNEDKKFGIIKNNRFSRCNKNRKVKESWSAKKLLEYQKKIMNEVDIKSKKEQQEKDLKVQEISAKLNDLYKEISEDYENSKRKRVEKVN